MSAVVTGALKAQFTGHNGSGTISIPGVKSGDLIVFIKDTNGTDESGAFGGAASITTDDQISQTSASDLSAITFTMLLIR